MRTFVIYQRFFLDNYHNTIKSLKQDFISEVPKRRLTMKEDIDSDEIERRIIAEVIEEVSGLSNNNNNEDNLEMIQCLDELGGRQQVQENEADGSRRQTSDQTNDSAEQNSNPSQHRNEQLLENPLITLTEVIPRIIPDPDSFLPEPTNEDAIELGLFTFPEIGRNIFDKINSSKTASTPLVSNKANTLEYPDVSAIETIEHTPQVLSATINDASNAPEQNQVEVNLPADQVVPTEKSSQNGKTREVRSQRLRENSNRIARNVLQFEDAAASSNRTVASNGNLTLQRQILESVRQELVADNKMAQKQKKKRVRRPRRRSVSPSNLAPTQQLHKDLVYHPKKTTNLVRPQYRLAIHFQENIFEGLDDYIVFQRDLEPFDVDTILQSLSIQNQEISREVERNEGLQRIQEPIEIEVPVMPQELNLPHVELVPANENTSIQQHYQEPMEIEVPAVDTMGPRTRMRTTPRPSLEPQRANLRPSGFRDTVQNSFTVPSEIVIPINSPQAGRVSLQNENLSVLKDVPVAPVYQSHARASQISAKDIEFAKFSNISRRRLEKSDQYPARSSSDLPTMQPKAHFVEVSGKTETLVKVVGFEKVETYSKYCMEVS